MVPFEAKRTWQCCWYRAIFATGVPWRHTSRFDQQSGQNAASEAFDSGAVTTFVGTARITLVSRLDTPTDVVLYLRCHASFSKRSLRAPVRSFADRPFETTVQYPDRV